MQTHDTITPSPSPQKHKKPAAQPLGERDSPRTATTSELKSNDAEGDGSEGERTRKDGALRASEAQEG